MKKQSYFSVGSSPQAMLGFTITILLAVSLFGMSFNSTQQHTVNDTTKTITAKALNGHSCNATEWHFVITQVNNAQNAPASIHVTWDTGAQEDVALWKFTGGTAHYLTTDNLNANVTSATAVIYSGWGGQFNLSHGPCGNPPSTPAPEPSPTPSPAFGVW